jgi:peroxiredoxin
MKTYKTFAITIGIISTIILSTSLTSAQNGKDIEDVHGIKVGVKAPLFTAVNTENKTFSLEEELKNGAVVLIFYRGFWCPVCNKHLSRLQDSLKQIQATGAQVIAISPEKPEYLDKMVEKTGAEFTLLYDKDYKIANAFGVTFKPSAMQLITYNTVLGAGLKDSHSDDSQRLPIPATYIINQEGIIIWLQFDPNYKNRSTVQGILNALENDVMM